MVMGGGAMIAMRCLKDFNRFKEEERKTGGKSKYINILRNCLFLKKLYLFILFYNIFILSCFFVNIFSCNSYVLMIMYFLLNVFWHFAETYN